jgi:hypothetical protein
VLAVLAALQQQLTIPMGRTAPLVVNRRSVRLLLLAEVWVAVKVCWRQFLLRLRQGQVFCLTAGVAVSLLQMVLLERLVRV